MNSRKYGIAIEGGRFGLLITSYSTSRRKKQELAVAIWFPIIVVIEDLILRSSITTINIGISQLFGGSHKWRALILSAQVFEGHPFIVEAGVSVGGKDVKQGLNIFRFANRIPLLFEQGADVVTRTALKRINWSSYKINQIQDKIGVFVSIVSTKIPFKGTGKEYIGDDITEIASAVKYAIQQCCVQLKSKIVKKMQAREQQERKRNLSRYIPDASAAVYNVLKEMTQLHASKKIRYEDDDLELLRKVSENLLTKETLSEKLAKHVEQVDYEMALEYATQSGVSEEPRETIYIQSLEAENKMIDLQTPFFVFRLFQ